MVKNNRFGKPIRQINIAKVKQQVMNELKAEVLQGRRNQKKPKKQGRKAPRQNQTRTITDVPLGNSQRMGFNRYTASKTVTKDEYIGDVAGTVAFTTTQFAVNPGQAATFPWLAIEAKQWEKYEFEKLEFYLKPEVTQYTANANSGKVILSFDSDASDPPPLNKQEAEDVMPMADGMSYQTINLNIPKFILQSHHDSFYVRPGNLPGGSDIKTYDLGNLFVSTIGQGEAVPNMMELRVRYTCRLMIPILENIAAAPQNNQVTFLVDSAAVLTSTVAYQPLLASVSSTSRPVTNGLNIVNTIGSIVPPPGNYMLFCSSFAANTTDSMTVLEMNVLKNNIVQNPLNGLTSAVVTAVDYSALTLNSSQWISCNGTDAITLSINSTFASGATTATTTLCLMSI